VWEPVEDKKGIWKLSVYYKGKEVAGKQFILV
ncbi:MAG: DUF3859 domain-containing protein, partial [Bacteroidia bacterium]|nr:DUF3859 domain-containing protein [Bacteroidia bacterium]